VAETQDLIKSCEESYELVSDSQENFSLWVQGKHIYSKNCELDLEIRLKEEYNNYTEKMIQIYKA